MSSALPFQEFPESQPGLSQPSSPPARWTAVSVFALASAWNYLDRGVLSAAAPGVKAEFHLSNTDYGFLVSAFGLAYALAAPGVGWLLDRIGLELGIVISVALWSLSAAICGVSRTLGQLAFGRIFLGIWESAGIPAAGKLNTIYLEPKDLASGAAMTQIGIGLAGVGAPLLVAAFTGWRTPFFVAAGLRARLDTRLGRSPPHRPSVAASGPQEAKWRFRASGRPPPHRPFPCQRPLDGRIHFLVELDYPLPSPDLPPHHSTRQLLRLGPPVASVAGGFAGGWISRRAINRGMKPVDARIYGALISAIGCFVTVLAPYAPTPLLSLLPISASYFAIVAGSCNIYALPLDLWAENARASPSPRSASPTVYSDRRFPSDRLARRPLRLQPRLLARRRAADSGLAAAQADANPTRHIVNRGP